MNRTTVKKGLIFGIVILLASISFTPVLSGTGTRTTPSQPVSITSQLSGEKTTTVTFYVFQKTWVQQQTITVSAQDAATISARFQDLKKELAVHPYNDQTRTLVAQFVSLLTERHAIPAGVTSQDLMKLLKPPALPSLPLMKRILPLESSSSQWFCNFATTGEGAAFPIIILPRFIPFILMPIPRVFVRWSTPDGITSVGGLLSHKGFVAEGEQKGLALGFWGIGFSIFLPPIDAYGIIGYALYAKVNAQYIEFYPPNSPPEITQTDPADKQTMVPIATQELRFNIADADKDPMSYVVTTEPDIGSGSGGLKSDGTYSIPVSGLQSLTTYSWHISVSDGKDTTEKTCTFTTEPVAPLISDPSPVDGDRNVPPELTKLQFTIKDFQGDLMDYTVQTSPNIGSASGTGVHDGTYSVAVSGLQTYTSYRWYVNVTDGTHWTRKTFGFETGFLTQYDPFQHGWQYRKQITIDHANIPEDLTSFPVLVSITDNDLKEKAQPSGDDILFMNNTGFATLLYFEVEKYDASHGALTAWVNIPQLSSTQDTVFYLYYGNPSTLSQQIPDKVWDPHYQAVWHMNDDTLATIRDSTSNGYEGTKIAPGEPTQQQGMIGDSQEFDGVNDYLQFADPVTTVGPKTVSTWFKCENPDSYNVVCASGTGISSNDAGTDWSVLDTGYTLECVLGNGQESGHFMKVTLTIPDTTNWHLYTMTYDGTTLRGYRDGVLVASSTTQSGSEAPPSYDLRMGKTNHPSYTYYMKGGLDEFRIADMAFSEGYVATQYLNQNNPSGFITVGPEVPGP